MDVKLLLLDTRLLVIMLLLEMFREISGFGMYFNETDPRP